MSGSDALAGEDVTGHALTGSEATGDRAAGDGAAGRTWVVIAGGGTAGHVLPGIAVAEALVARGHERSTVLMVGSERGLETRIVPQAGFPFVALPGRGIQRRLTVDNLKALWGLTVAFLRALTLVRRLKPKVVVVLGGYASLPCALAAIVFRIPIVICEQNARAGAANRLVGRFARAAAVPFGETDLPRSVVTGNPVRAEVLAIDHNRDRARSREELALPADRTVIGVFSGSLGATSINNSVRGLVSLWADRNDIAIRHVVGERDWSSLEDGMDGSRSDGLVYQPVRYEDRMDLLLAAADLVVCRAGGTTVAELAEVGVASILVPFPGAPRDHQAANAQALVRAGAAVLVRDGELDTARLVELIEPLVSDPTRLATMSSNARTLAHPDAASRVADLVEEHARA